MVKNALSTVGSWRRHTIWAFPFLQSGGCIATSLLPAGWLRRGAMAD